MSTKHLYLVLGLIALLKMVFALCNENISTWEDHEIALNLLNEGEFYYRHDGVVNHSFQFPIYPCLLYLTYSIYNSPQAGILLNCLLSFFSCLLFYKNCLKTFPQFNSTILFVLALSPALHPAFINYELRHVHPFIHDFLFLNIGLFALISIWKNREHSPTLVYGLVLGLCVLGRGSFIVIPVIAFCILLKNKQIKDLSLTVLGVLLVLGVWIFHNYKTDGVFALTSTQGKILWKGSLANSQGGNLLNNGETYYNALSQKNMITLGLLDVKGQNDFFIDKYILLWKTNSWQPIKMFILKLKNFWFFSASTKTNETIWFIFRILNCLFIVGLLFLTVRTKNYVLLVLPLCLSLFQCFFYFEPRHRFLIDPILLFILISMLVKSTKKSALN